MGCLVAKKERHVLTAQLLTLPRRSRPFLPLPPFFPSCEGTFPAGRGSIVPGCSTGEPEGITGALRSSGRGWSRSPLPSASEAPDAVPSLLWDVRVFLGWCVPLGTGLDTQPVLDDFGAQGHSLVESEIKGGVCVDGFHECLKLLGQVIHKLPQQGGQHGCHLQARSLFWVRNRQARGRDSLGMEAHARQLLRLPPV